MSNGAETREECVYRGFRSRDNVHDRSLSAVRIKGARGRRAAPSAETEGQEGGSFLLPLHLQLTFMGTGEYPLEKLIKYSATRWEKADASCTMPCVVHNP